MYFNTGRHMLLLGGALYLHLGQRTFVLRKPRKIRVKYFSTGTAHHRAGQGASETPGESEQRPPRMGTEGR